MTTIGNDFVHSTNFIVENGLEEDKSDQTNPKATDSNNSSANSPARASATTSPITKLTSAPICRSSSSDLLDFYNELGSAPSQLPSLLEGLTQLAESLQTDENEDEVITSSSSNTVVVSQTRAQTPSKPVSTGSKYSNNIN